MLGGARAKACPLKVVASGDRRYTPWLGGGVVGNLSACKRTFVTRDEYEARGTAVLAERCAPLAARLLDEQIKVARALAAAEDAEYVVARQHAAAAARTHAAEAMGWWTDSAPANGAVERQRMGTAQRLVVAPLTEAVLRMALQAEDAAEGTAEGSIARRRRLPLPPAAALAAVASVLRLTAGGSEPSSAHCKHSGTEEAADERHLRQLKQMQAASWAAAVSVRGDAFARAAAHSDPREAAAAWAAWTLHAKADGSRRRCLGLAVASWRCEASNANNPHTHP